MNCTAIKNNICLITVLFLINTLTAQKIDTKKLDSLFQNGQNYSVLREINSLDTLKWSKLDMAFYHLYKAKSLEAESNEDKAYFSYLQAKKLFIASGNLDKAMEINLDIAYLSSFDKTNRIKADQYIQEYLNQALKNGKNLQIAKGYERWASSKLEDFPLESLALFKKSENYSLKANDDAQLQGLYSNLAVLYNEMLKKPDSAIYYIDKSIVYAKKINDNDGLCINLINKASCFYYKNEYQKAIQTLLQADKLSLTKNVKKIKSYIYEFLALNYSSLGDFEKAFENLNQSIELKAEFDFEEQNIKISEFNIKYETKEKEIENLTLKVEIQRSQVITYASLGLLFVALLFSVLVYKNSSKKKKIAEQDQLIQKQKLEKTLKDREVQDIDLILKSQEKERQQIANELHDNLGSLLATLKLNFQSLSRSKKEEDKNLFDKTDALLEETYQKVRSISHLKNMGVVGNEGLLVAVKKMAEKMTVINRLKINVIPFGLTQRLSNSTEVTLFRIIQELCTNSIKHSEADEVNIYLTQHNPDLINVIVEDNGVGFDYKTVIHKDGIGLKSIEKKVEQMGGTFTVDSIISKGTTIIIDLAL